MTHQPDSGNEKLPPLEEIYGLLQRDATTLLKDLLRGISMWGITALVAFFLAFSAFGLAFAIQTFGHPFGSPPGVLYALDSAYFVSVASAVAGAFLLWRFLSLRRRYSDLFKIAKKLN